jgi:hypothetical protein
MRKILGSKDILEAKIRDISQQGGEGEQCQAGKREDSFKEGAWDGGVGSVKGGNGFLGGLEGFGAGDVFCSDCFA